MPEDAIKLARLLRLASPALPVGAFSYSQGLEWAVDRAVVRDEASAQRWIGSLLAANMARFELPVLAAMYTAWDGRRYQQALALNEELLASRETVELRAETLQTGGALLNVLLHDGEHEAAALEPLATMSDATFPAAYAFAAAQWRLGQHETLTSYAWSWLENQVMAAMKLVPLGQRAGQRLLATLTPRCAQAVETALGLPPDEWSNFAPLFAIACSRHETQYSRLFRS